MTGSAGAWHETLDILTDGSRYLVVGATTGREVAVTDDADEAVDRAIAAQRSVAMALAFGPGRFIVTRPIRVSEGGAIRGAGPATKLACTDPAAEAVIVASAVARPSIERLTVTAGTGPSAASGIMVNGCLGARVHDVTAIGFPEVGIRVCGHSALTHVGSSLVADCGEAAVQLRDLTRGPHGDFLPNLVTSTIVVGGGVGFDCASSIVVNLVACVAHQTGGHGYYIHDGSNSVLISGSRSFQVGGDALRVEASDELTVTGNIFCWHVGRGIVVRGCRWGSITGNSVIDSGSVNPGGPDQQTRFADLDPQPRPLDAIRLEDASGFTITGNAIFNWGVAPPLASGVVVDSTSRHVVVEANAVNYFVDDAVRLEGQDQVGSSNHGFAGEPLRCDQPPGVLVQSYDSARILDGLRTAR